VQIIATLDIVDQEKSIIKDYGTFKILQLPTFRRDSARRRRPSSEYSARCEPLRVGGVVLPAHRGRGAWELVGARSHPQVRLNSEPNSSKEDMTSDFYCDEALSGRTPVDVVLETDEVLAFHHTRPFWPVHIVVVPKRHIPSLIDLGDGGETALHQVLAVVRQIAAQVTADHGACRVLTNLGEYQDSKHLHFHVNSGDSAG
jgi:histidine triad (HIT) family protein